MAIVISGTTGIDAGSLPVSNCGNTEVEGNLNLSGVGVRITGDFSNATYSNRVAFQTSTLNGLTTVAVIPNGTATNASFQCYSSSDMNNSTRVHIGASATAAEINSSAVGTANYVPLIFTTSATERMRIDTAGNVGIGVIPSATPTSFKTVQIGADGTGLYGYNTSFGMLLATNAKLDGSTWKYSYGGGYASCMMDIGNDVAGAFIWKTSSGGTAGNAINWTTAMTLEANGKLLLTSSTGGLGYGTGAGGTVTQLTSKSTAVTLNKPTGTITMNNAALAAGASVDFLVNNTLYTAGYDGILLTSGTFGSNYSFEAKAYNTNQFLVRVKNITGISLSENVSITFQIIKGAIA